MEVAAIWSEQIFESYYMGRQPCSNEWNLWTLVWSFADYRTFITNRAPYVQNIATGLSQSTVINSHRRHDQKFIRYTKKETAD